MSERLSTSSVDDLVGYSLLPVHPAAAKGDLPKQCWVGNEELLSSHDLASAKLASRKPRNLQSRKEYENLAKELKESSPSAQLGTYERYLELNLNQITLTFSTSGKAKFAKLTRENCNRQVAIVVDDQVLSTTTIQKEIRGGVVVIIGQFTREEKEYIVKRINGVQE